MPNNGDTSNYTSVFRLTPPNDPHRKVIKRNRQVVSCVPCRTRKLKCDRQQPCSSCVKRGDAASCRFFGTPSPGAGGAGSAPSTVPKTEMQARLQRLEALFSGLRDQPGLDVAAAAAARSTDTAGGGGAVTREPWMTGSVSSDVSGGRLSKEDDGVRPAAASNYGAVLEAIHDLQDVIDAEAPDHLSARSPLGLSQDGERRHCGAQQPGSPARMQLRGPVAPLTTREILERLPSRFECDKILTFFFQPVHIVPMMIHGGHFQRTYLAFWADPDSANPLWISTLFSFLSTAVFQQASKDAGGEGLGATDLVDPAAREKIEELSSMAYRCLVAGSLVEGKPYSVEAALSFGMHLVLQKRDADPICWHTISTAVRLAQRMGYHRDPEKHLNKHRNSAYARQVKITPFEAEMRRRTWYSLEYFDLLSSVLQGVPPVVHGDDVDTRLPLNLRDEDFDEHSAALPPARPSTDYTPVLCYVYHNRQVQLLRRVVRQDQAAARPAAGEVAQLDADLRALRGEVPPSLRYRPVRESGFADVPDVIMRRVQFEMMYLKATCVLHRRHVTSGLGDGEGGDVYGRSREACRGAAMRLLELQAEFDEQSGEGGRLFEKRYLLTNMGFHDFLLAAACVCLDLVVGQRDSTQQDVERKVSALKRARLIWRKTAGSSREAAHATKVLDVILTRVSSLSGDAAGPTSPSRTTDDGRRRLTADSTPAEKVGTGSDASPAGWMAVNYAGLSRRAGGRDPKGWGFGLDGIERGHVAVGKSGDEFGLFVGDDVDWNDIDSFLLDRERITGFTVSSTATTDDTNPRKGEDPPYVSQRLEKDNNPKEGWPYPNYDDVTRGTESTTNFRTWARGEI